MSTLTADPPTTAHTAGPPDAAAAQVHPTFAGVMRGEWIKLLSLRSYFGATLHLHEDLESEGIELDDIELQLVPDGPLIDGSQGETITRRLTGWEVLDIPVGKYTVSMTYHRPDGSDVALLVKVRNTETDVAQSVSAVAAELLEIEYQTP